MALQSLVQFAGLSKADGYWILGALSWNRSSYSTVQLRVDGYASKEAFESGQSAIESVNVDADLANPAVASQFEAVKGLAYALIKLNDRFVDAIEVE